MSKNFEVLQRLQRQLGRAPKIEPMGGLSETSNDQWEPKRNLRLDPNGSAPEEVRKLVEKIFISRGKSSPRVVAFAGLDSAEYCSRIIAEVAVTLAAAEIGRVCLVDGYFHSPSLSEWLNCGNPCGLIEASRLGEPILQFAIPACNGSLSLLPWGSLDAGSANHLPLDQLKQWFDELRVKFDYVLVNAPPLNQFADGIAFGQLSDGLVPVFDKSATEPAMALRQLERLCESRVQVYGPVWNYGLFHGAEDDPAYGKGDAAAVSISVKQRGAGT